MNEKGDAERINLEKHSQTQQEIKTLCEEALRTGTRVSAKIRDDSSQKGKPLGPEITTTTFMGQITKLTDTSVTITSSLGSMGHLDGTFPFEDIASIALKDT